MTKAQLKMFSNLLFTVKNFSELAEYLTKSLKPSQRSLVIQYAVERKEEYPQLGQRIDFLIDVEDWIINQKTISMLLPCEIKVLSIHDTNSLGDHGHGLWDDVEWHGIYDDGAGIVEQIDDKVQAPTYYSVYIHLVDGGLYWIADVKDKGSAEKMAGLILRLGRMFNPLTAK